ncbi:MAG: 3-phosphoglycerate dehydrogenase [Gammaproteobacteria bacterium]|nr:3-phosphoglycerate dehydrogenase [Gammaproteobacteria bacterium]NIR82939.1 3-phosphoglycerate dehydrogenase [Gammaproteobacteria bacterium]NIR90208.1 3-phosphoglycerate dehydrogenase [Gammaproteobacteria bacterium]NIU04085.1 3-phosphoglycerate dehydrogenase [Gammaproteobacteria bacterium]NIV51074.1 3-phosphoglycerate dehydrogenase [Gammaproteobacteria bacterium]
MAERKRIVYPDADAQLAERIVGHRLERLRSVGELIVHHGRPPSPEEFIRRLERASAVLLGWDLPAEVMRAVPSIEVVSFTGTGPEKFVDLDLARELGITVTNTPGYSANAVAEHALALLFATARKTALLDRMLRAGHWDQSQSAFELRGKTLGLVGFGGIAQRLAALARGLEMRVLAWTRRPSEERAARHGVEFVPLERLLGASDVVSLHLASTPETRGFLGAVELDRMRRGAVLINTARAELLDQAALIERLRSGAIAGAGLDVFAQEPLPAGHPLLALDNVVVTPHVGFNTPEAVEALLDIGIDNLVGYFRGTPIHVVAGPGGRSR